jgi:Sec-independent protein translocase protein (TatC)
MAKEKLLSEYEAAATVGMSPTLLRWLGIVFEMPILVFFLSLMGIVSAGWMWRNLRYSILVIFIIAAIITPTTDIMNMCIFRTYDRALPGEHRHRLVRPPGAEEEAKDEGSGGIAAQSSVTAT